MTFLHNKGGAGSRRPAGYVWNPNKTRMELWVPCSSDPSRSILRRAHPGRNWTESFVAPVVIAPGTLGLVMERMWAINGRKGGAVSPDQANYINTGEVSGGIYMRVLSAGGQAGDYNAIHWDGSYAISVSKSPHLHASVDFVNNADVAYIAGIVDNTKSAGTNAFALPNNGIYFILDTQTYGDANVRFVVRLAGADAYVVNLGPAPVGYSSGYIFVDDGGTTVYAELNGVPIGSYGTLPAQQMTPYAAIVNRGVGAPPADLDLKIRDLTIIQEYP